jgi:hypothetical protein
MGRAILVETIEKGLDPIIISYETMLTLQRPYLCQLYDNLGIETTFLPTFKNGNTKYLKQGTAVEGGFDPVEMALMKEDGSQPRDIPPAVRHNVARPGSRGVTYRAVDRHPPPRSSMLFPPGRVAFPPGTPPLAQPQSRLRGQRQHP